MSRTLRIVSRLVEKACESDMGSMHAACIVQGGKITNIMSNSQREFINGHRMSSTHAEIAAIYDFLKRPGGGGAAGDMWVIRILFNNDDEPYLASSKPCNSCLCALKKYNINRIFYSDDNGNIKCEKIRELNNTYTTSFQKNKWGRITNWNLVK